MLERKPRLPATTATCGKLAMRWMSDAGNVAANEPTGATNTSAEPAKSRTSSSTPVWVVALVTRTPNRIATPSTMPVAVSAERPFLCASCLEPSEDSLRTIVTTRRLQVQSFGQPAILQQDHLVAERRGARVVRDHDARLAEVALRVLQQRQHLDTDRKSVV